MIRCETTCVATYPGGPAITIFSGTRVIASGWIRGERGRALVSCRTHKLPHARERESHVLTPAAPMMWGSATVDRCGERREWQIVLQVELKARGTARVPTNKKVKPSILELHHTHTHTHSENRIVGRVRFCILRTIL